MDNILDPRCSPDSVDSLSIPNGVVCYNGTTLGSTAYYICNGDYEVFGRSDCENKDDLRECQQDGHWSGETIHCLQPTNGIYIVVYLFHIMLFKFLYVSPK